MSELMNLNMVLPEPLNPPFPARASLQELGRVHFVGIGGAGMSALTEQKRRLFRLYVKRALVFILPKMLRIFTILIPLLSQRPFTKITPN